MRRTLKLLLLIGIGFALRRTGDGDGPTNRSGNGSNPDTPPQRSPSGKINTDQGTESASQAVQAEAEKGRSQQSGGNTDSKPTGSSGRDPKAGPPVDPDNMLPEAGTIADHANDRFSEGALDHYVSGIPNDQLSTYVHNVMEGNIDGIDTRYGLDNGRVAYYDQETGAVVIEDPGTPHGGTVFSPSDGNNGRTYFNDLT